MVPIEDIRSCQRVNYKMQEGNKTGKNGQNQNKGKTKQFQFEIFLNEEAQFLQNSPDKEDLISPVKRKIKNML